jgi:hypothetical protein
LKYFRLDKIRLSQQTGDSCDADASKLLTNVDILLHNDNSLCVSNSSQIDLKIKEHGSVGQAVQFTKLINHSKIK